MRTMLMLAGIVAATLTLGVRPGSAQQGSWCAMYSGDGGTNCYFYTFDQCRAAVSGVGGSCSPNPRGGLSAPPRYAPNPLAPIQIGPPPRY